MQETVILDEGSYIVVPMTTGALLTKPLGAETGKIEFKVQFQHITMPHPYYFSTMNDIFRKVDLALNGKLSAGELNQFGKIIDNKEMQKLKQTDFTSSAFKTYSCDKEGLTNLGFKQYLFRNLKDKQISTMLDKLGYDQQLYSTKSRVFVMTFQSDYPIKVKINESIFGDMNKRVWDLYMNKKLMDNHVDIEHEYSNKDHVVFSVNHNKSYGVSYGIANNTEEFLEVEIDMTESPEAHFAPKDGIATVIVPPKSLKYLGSTVSDPKATDVTFYKDIKINEIDPPEGFERSVSYQLSYIFLKLIQNQKFYFRHS